MLSHRRRVAAIVMSLALVAAACGDDDEDTTSGSASASGPEESTTAPAAGDQGEAPVALDGSVNDHGTEEIGDTGEVELELDDFYFGPTYLRGEPGATVMFVLENEGDAPHTFTIDALDIDTEVAPGESTEVEVTLPDQDATLFYCRFHQDQGMQGAVFFEEGDELAAARGTNPAGGPYGG